MAIKFKPITEEALSAAVGARLRGLRGDVALETVAKGAGVAPRGYFDVERGGAFPNLRTLLKLANYHQLSVKELLP